MLGGLIKDIFKWLYYFPFRLLVRNIPFGWTYLLGKYAGMIFYYAASSKRRALEAELERISGRSGADRTFIIKKTFINKVRTEFESLFYPDLNKGNIGRLVECEGLSNLDTALKKGKGAMLLFGHFGANQMVMPAIGYRGYSMCQMSAPPTVWEDKMPDRKFSRISRRGLEIRWKNELSLPVKHINVFGSVKEAFMCLKRNEVLGIAMDGGGGKKHVTTDFCGRKALFATGAIEIAMKTDCAVLPAFVIRRPNGTNLLIIEPEMPIRPDGKSQAAIEENISFFAKRLEEYVYKYPCHYIDFLALRSFTERNGESPFILDDTAEHEREIGASVK